MPHDLGGFEENRNGTDITKPLGSLLLVFAFITWYVIFSDIFSSLYLGKVYNPCFEVGLKDPNKSVSGSNEKGTILVGTGVPRHLLSHPRLSLRPFLGLQCGNASALSADNCKKIISFPFPQFQKTHLIF